jgi:hypothetical protein
MKIVIGRERAQSGYLQEAAFTKVLAQDVVMETKGYFEDCVPILS